VLCSVLCALYSVFCVLCSVIINDVCCSSCAPWPTPLPVFFERRSHHAPKRCTIVQALHFMSYVSICAARSLWLVL
jgi:hypothetical protein